MAQDVLLVVDMLNDFMHPEGALYCGEEARGIVEPLAARIREYVGVRKPVVFLKDGHDPDDTEFKLFGKHAVSGGWGSELLDEMKEAVRGYKGIHTVPKKRYSGFFGTNLEELLASFHVFESREDFPVEVCGVCTSICVMDTVGDLANRDVRSLVSRSLVADFDPEQHACSLARMEKIYGARVTD